MANVLGASARFGGLIIDDTVAKAGVLHVFKAYVHQAEVAEPEAVDITDIAVKQAITNVTATVIAVDKIAINAQISLQASYQFNRVYLVNKNDSILYVLDISELTQSEINMDFIVQITDVVTIAVA